jgi:DNA-binding NtrC family response regulator
VTLADASTVRRLHRIRVLIVGRDRRFLRMASLLLARRGCAVDVTDNPDEVFDRVSSRRTDVVVLDGTDSLRAAARAMAALEAHWPPVPVVVVYDDAGDGPVSRLHVVPKWGAFDRLVEAVENSYGHQAENGAPDAAS